ncbi:helix-turn-helix transcriptional regulator [Geodermatophilus sp. URMC 61]|uniref:helix-turn-helix transcriptional regulator n=1 Tax=Geodermatophilus sp. URMC 61 TaxID=3423411 RepID=UPI00406C8EB6
MSLDLSGLVRRIRRTADMSQRELAARTGLSKTTIAAAEAGNRDLGVTRLALLAEVAGLRLVLLDAEGREVTGMDPGGARDATQRRLPAHLDTQPTDQVADRWAHRPDRQQRGSPSVSTGPRGTAGGLGPGRRRTTTSPSRGTRRPSGAPGGRRRRVGVPPRNASADARPSDGRPTRA